MEPLYEILLIILFIYLVLLINANADLVRNILYRIKINRKAIMASAEKTNILFL